MNSQCCVDNRTANLIDVHRGSHPISIYFSSASLRLCERN